MSREGGLKKSCCVLTIGITQSRGAIKLKQDFLACCGICCTAFSQSKAREKDSASHA